MIKNPKNVNALKNSNRASILNLIRQSPMARVDISRKLGLTKSAVTMLTNEMINEGLLLEVGQTKKISSPGRTSILLDIVPNYAYAIGVMLHRKNISISLTDLKMNKLAETTRPTISFLSPIDAVNWIDTTINSMLTKTNISLEQCVGIGISSPGPLDYIKGIILKPPHFTLFNNYPIVQKIKERFNCPVFLENNSVALAIADFYARGGSSGNTLFVVAADGIGSALLQDGVVFRGTYGYAGELGHVSINMKGNSCSCGNRGCLEQYATLSAMKERFKFKNYKDIIDGTLNNNKTYAAILDDLVTNLGTAIVSCVNLYDLKMVVIFGEYSYKAEELTKRLEEYISKNSIICRVHPVKVVPSLLAFNDTSVASAVSAINYFFEQNN